MKLFITLHQTKHKIADFEAIFSNLKRVLSPENEAELHLFPELYLTGYPLQDLCLQKSFKQSYETYFNELESWLLTLDKKPELGALVGGLFYHPESEEGLLGLIENCIYFLTPGEKIKKVYTKKLLPNYDIFDEKKYFHSGNEVSNSHLFEFNNTTFGLLICEDMWGGHLYQNNPLQNLVNEAKASKAKLHAIINLSASPFDLNKQELRIKKASEVVSKTGIPFLYVNRVGGEDEILFDGNSFVLDGLGNKLVAKNFEAQELEWVLTNEAKSLEQDFDIKPSNTYAALFSPRLENGKLRTLTNNECEGLVNALTFGLQEYLTKTGHKKLLVALSGGIDSALALALAKISLRPDQELEALFMPGNFTATASYELCEQMCTQQNIPLKILPIKFLHSTAKNAYLQAYGKNLTGLANENIQSRLRGTMLYAHSNMTQSLVINTSNKSELSVGYSTQYGDSVGAISLLGDLYKSEIFTFSHYLNQNFKNIIPEGIITRPPTAELSENQLDEDSLPPYEQLDAILEGILSYRLNHKDLENHGFSTQIIKKILNLYQVSEYKRAQFCPIIKVKSKSFGFGYRNPICKSTEFYLK